MDVESNGGQEECDQLLGTDKGYSPPPAVAGCIQLTLFWTSVYEGNLVPSKVNRLVSSLRLALITNMVIAAGGVKGCGLVGYGDGKTRSAGPGFERVRCQRSINVDSPDDGKGIEEACRCSRASLIVCLRVSNLCD